MNDDTNSPNVANKEKNVCLHISDFKLSLLYFFTIDLFIFTELTTNAKIHGISTMFFTSIVLKQNIKPDVFPSVAITADIE